MPSDDKSKQEQAKYCAVGDILRYSNTTSTSLMRVSYVHYMWKGTKFECVRYYGQHYFGGLVGARHEACQLASYAEKEAWYNEGRRKTADKKRLLRVPWEMFVQKFSSAKAVGADDADR